MRIDFSYCGVNYYIEIDNDTKVQLVDEGNFCKIYTARIYAQEVIEITTVTSLYPVHVAGGFVPIGMGCGIDALSAASNAIHNSTLIGSVEVEALVRSEIEARELKGKTVQASCEAKSRRL